MYIAVVFGGESEEREVSLSGAHQVIDVLRSRGHRVRAVDTQAGVLELDQEKAFFETNIRAVPPTAGEYAGVRNIYTVQRLLEATSDVDVAFLVLHGGSGEDGHIQALLDMAGVSYTGSGFQASCVAMDKHISKMLMRSAGVLTPDWAFYKTCDELRPNEFGFPVIVKPVSQGSTVGLFLARTEEEYKHAFAQTQQFGDVMVEQFIAGREFTVGVLGEQALGVGEIGVDPQDIFSYEQKYQGKIDEIFPADLAEEKTSEIQQAAYTVHKTLGLSGYSRCDIRVDEQGRVWVIETNTLPGMTPQSLLPQSAAVVGIDYAELCDRIVKQALVA